YKPFEALLFVPMTLLSVVFPALSIYHRDRPAQMIDAVGKFFKALFVIGWPMSVGIFVLAHPLTHSLQLYDQSEPALRILALGLAIGFANNAFIGALSASDHQSSFTWAAGWSLLANVALNLALIPTFGYIGASWATVATEIVLGGAACDLTARHIGRVPVLSSTCRAPINPYARRRHQIDRSMLIGAPGFKDARRAFLRFAQGAVLVEHSHDAFDTWLVGRGLESPLEHPIIDTTALARLVMEIPKGQVPGLQRLVTELGLDITPAHAALDDARATAMVFRALAQRAMEQLGLTTVGDVLTLVPRPVVDRTPNRKASAADRARGAPARTGQPRSAAPAAPRRATSPAQSARPGRSRRRRRSGSSGSPGGSPA